MAAAHAQPSEGWGSGLKKRTVQEEKKRIHGFDSENLQLLMQYVDMMDRKQKRKKKFYKLHIVLDQNNIKDSG